MSMLERIERSGVVAIVRLDDYTHAPAMAIALVDGGVEAIEFTYTNPAAGEAVRATKDALGDRMLVGAGTVLDPETARAAILLGADFIVTPTVQVETIRLCNRYSVPTVIGAFTPRAAKVQETMIRQIARECLEAIEPESVHDLVEALAVPLPMYVIAEMLGVSRSDRPRFKRWSDALIAAGGGAGVVSASGQEKAPLTAYGQLDKPAETSAMYQIFTGKDDAAGAVSMGQA